MVTCSGVIALSAVCRHREAEDTESTCSSTDTDLSNYTVSLDDKSPLCSPFTSCDESDIESAITGETV